MIKLCTLALYENLFSGGAVRDKLLGLIPKDNDWVVVGATPNDMLTLGYKQVPNGQLTSGFPVFLHPETKDEYALARCEKRIGHGHGGFEFDISPNITLIEDLKRRDLTINAMAMSFEQGKLGELIDPYSGQSDLEKKYYGMYHPHLLTILFDY